MAASHESESFALDEGIWNRLAVQCNELRLEIEKLELARAARHEKVDDALGLRREVGLVQDALEGAGCRGSTGVGLQKLGQGDSAEPEGETPEKITSIEAEIEALAKHAGRRV